MQYNSGKPDIVSWQVLSTEKYCGLLCITQLHWMYFNITRNWDQVQKYPLRKLISEPFIPENIFINKTNFSIQYEEFTQSSLINNFFGLPLLFQPVPPCLPFSVSFTSFQSKLDISVSVSNQKKCQFWHFWLWYSQKGNKI